MTATRKSTLRKKLEQAGLPMLDANAKTPTNEIMVKARLFALASGATWLITEANAVTKDGKEKSLADATNDDLDDVMMFGYADLYQQGRVGGAEFGYISLAELESMRLGPIPRVEFDSHFTPKPFAECVHPDGRIK